MVIKIVVPPSAVAGMINHVRTADASCTIQAHAGNGVIVARFSQFRQDDFTKLLVGKLRPAAVQLGGSLIVVRSKLEGLTPHLVWGGRNDAIVLLEQIKQQFDPQYPQPGPIPRTIEELPRRAQRTRRINAKCKIFNAKFKTIVTMRDIAFRTFALLLPSCP